MIVKTKWAMAFISCILVFVVAFLLIPPSIHIEASKGVLGVGVGFNNVEPQDITAQPEYNWGFPVAFNETESFINVGMGDFTIGFAKGTVGFDIISYNGSILAEQQRFEIQRQQNANQWRVAGDVIGVSWEKISDYEYQVIRHYDNYGGVTSNVTYSIKAYEPIKITLTINSGVANTYRLAWLLDGIHQADYDLTSTSCTFGYGEPDQIGVDWEDVFLSFGDITTYEVTDIAAGKKIQLYFTVGNVDAGEVLILDPSIKGKGKTNEEKLSASYSLIEQMRILRNQQCDLYVTDKEHYAIKWEIYKGIYQRLQVSLLKDRNALKGAVLLERYPDIYEMSEGEQHDVADELLSDRMYYKNLATSASSDVLNKLAGITLDDIDGNFVDPYEDWTSSDWNNGTPQEGSEYQSVTANNITTTECPRNDDAYFYREYEVTDNCSYTLETMHLGNLSGGQYAFLGASDSENISDNDPANVVMINVDWYSTGTMYLYTWNGTTWDYDTSALSTATQYWLTFNRASDTTSVIICDDDEGNEVDTISATRVGTEGTLPYLYSSMTNNTGSGAWISCWVANFDLQEAGGEPSLQNTPSSEDLGTAWWNKTYYAAGSAPNNPVQDGDCTFTITNDGSITENITASMSDMTGNVTWSCVAGSPGANEFRMTLYYSGQNPASGIVLTNSAQAFYNGLAASANISWDLKYETGTWTNGDVAQRTGNLQLTAVEP